MKLGLKGSIYQKQFYDRIQQRPDILELHLFEDDLFGDRLKLLKERIQLCLGQNIQVLLHHPIIYREGKLNMLSDNLEDRLYYNLSTMILARLCCSYNINCVIHTAFDEGPIDNSTENIQETKKRIAFFDDMSGHRFLWENSVIGVFSFENAHLIDEIVRPLNLKMCFDITHAFITYGGDNQKLLNALDQAKPFTVYYHVVDSMGKEHDSLEVGKGKIDWESVLPYFQNHDHIYEIDLADMENCQEMISSHYYLQSLHSFDGSGHH